MGRGNPCCSARKKITLEKILVVGAGLTGLTIARCAAEKNIQSTVIDARDHIGGNAFSEIDPKTNIDVHKYGSHIFHTNNERIWEFVNSLKYQLFIQCKQIFHYYIPIVIHLTIFCIVLDYLSCSN